MSELYFTLIALLPSVGTIITALVILFRILFKFKELKDEVRNDAEVANVRKENKLLRAMVKSTQEQLDEVTKQLRKTTEIIVENNYKEDLIMQRLGEVVSNEQDYR